MILRNKRVLLLFPSAAVYAYAFYGNVSAPGNHVRKSIMEGAGLGMDAVPSIINSFAEAFLHLGEFTGLITVAFVVLLAPVIWRMVGKIRFSFSFPGVLLIWSVCLYATGFTPSLYAMGHAGLARTLNAVKLTYQVLLIVNEVYWLGWLHRKTEQAEGKGLPAALKRKSASGKERKISVIFFGLTGAAMLGIFSMASNQAGNYSAYGAYYYIHTGEANNFYQEYLKRVEILKSDEKDVVLEPYFWRPWFLCAGELSEDPEAEENRAVASWYGKNSVRIFREE